MKISVIHPSRGRPAQMVGTRTKWLDGADDLSNIEYIFSLDSDDVTIPHVITDWVRTAIKPNKSAIEAINNAAKVSTGDLIVVISDDFDCPEHWDTLLLKEISDHRDFVLKTVDGLQPTLVTLPIMDRIYYERYGYVYHPDYLHMASDVELTAVALMTGKLLRSDLVFPHLHYSAGLSPKDHINEKNDTTYEHGDRILAQHKVNNFGIENPVMKYDDIAW